MNQIHNFNKTFWCSLISNLTHLLLSMCSSVLVFVKKLLDNLFHLVLYFLYLWLLSLDYSVKWLVLLDSSFFSFCDYLCTFHQPSKICSKSYNWTIFKLIFLYLIDFGADFCWLIPRHTKGYSAWWQFSVKMCNTCTWIIKKKYLPDWSLCTNVSFKCESFTEHFISNFNYP